MESLQSVCVRLCVSEGLSPELDLKFRSWPSGVEVIVISIAD